MLEIPMARRRELKNVASGILCSFISRNNDVDGYWGIGKLCLLAQERAATNVKLDLLAEKVFPESMEFLKLLEGYHVFLQRHLAARGIPGSWVESAMVDLDFDPAEPPAKQLPFITWGKLFKLTMTILDDRNITHAVSAYGYCAPHNPGKEWRSIGQRF